MAIDLVVQLRLELFHRDEDERALRREVRVHEIVEEVSGSFEMLTVAGEGVEHGEHEHARVEDAQREHGARRGRVTRR